MIEVNICGVRAISGNVTAYYTVTVVIFKVQLTKKIKAIFFVNLIIGWFQKYWTRFRCFLKQ